MREIAITVKPTLSCNMRCRHCFNGENLLCKDIINIESVKILFLKASKEYKLIKVTFHGGEPTIVGINFYRDLFNFQHKLQSNYGVEFRNFFTTNGLLLNDEFIDLLIDNNTLINVSYDGPYNAVLREYSERVLKNIKLIQNKKGRIRCFCTLSNKSYEHLNEIYEWFKANNLDFKTLPIEKTGYAKFDESLLIKPHDIARKVADVYKTWIHDRHCNIRYYTFEEFSSLRRNTQFKMYWFNRKIAINPDNKIYPFGRPNDIKYCLGQPEDIESIEQFFNSDSYMELQHVLATLYKNKCRFCDSIGVCNGVAICMAYMYEETEELLDYSCLQANSIFQKILEVNDKIISDFKCGKINDYSDYIIKKFSKYTNMGSCDE